MTGRADGITAPAAWAGRAVRAGALLTAEVAAVVALHRLGSAPGFALPHGSMGRWLRETPALDATTALLRVVALIAAWWLLASTVWWLLVAARGALRGAVRGRSGPAMPGSRRLVEWALALSITGSLTLGGAAGAATPPTTAPATTTTTTTTPATTPTLVLEHVDRRDEPVPTTAAPTTPGGVRTGRGGLAAVPAPEPTPTTSEPRSRVTSSTPATTPAQSTPDPSKPDPSTGVHVVAPGENLWTIAAARVGARSGRAPDRLTAAEIAPYWLALCDRNRASIRSGNVSLVYPGEVLQLPD
jgi:hypothetical protein